MYNAVGVPAANSLVVGTPRELLLGCRWAAGSACGAAHGPEPSSACRGVGLLSEQGRSCMPASSWVSATARSRLALLNPEHQSLQNPFLSPVFSRNLWPLRKTSVVQSDTYTGKAALGYNIVPLFPWFPLCFTSARCLSLHAHIHKCSYLI